MTNNLRNTELKTFKNFILSTFFKFYSACILNIRIITNIPILELHLKQRIIKLTKFQS